MKIRKFNEGVDDHRSGLIELYEGQIQDAGPFMTIVLEEALRKLKESQIDHKRVETCVVGLEKAWRTV